MTETKPNHIVLRGRLFPEIQWTEEQKTQWKSTLEEHYQRCKNSSNNSKNLSHASLSSSEDNKIIRLLY